MEQIKEHGFYCDLTVAPLSIGYYIATGVGYIYEAGCFLPRLVNVVGEFRKTPAAAINAALVRAKRKDKVIYRLLKNNEPCITLQERDGDLSKFSVEL